MAQNNITGTSDSARRILQETGPRHENPIRHDYLLAKIWHTAQIVPITAEGVRQLNCTTAWYIWRGEIFRVPLSTLQRSVGEGGWKLVNIGTKSRALFVLRLRTQGQREGTPTADWLKKWNIPTGIQNPPILDKSRRRWDTYENT